MDPEKKKLNSQIAELRDALESDRLVENVTRELEKTRTYYSRRIENKKPAPNRLQKSFI